jgi:hypothetical protein
MAVAARKTYEHELAANVRAARARAGLTQRVLAERMTEMGYHWQHQLVGELEAGNRPLLAGAARPVRGPARQHADPAGRVRG